jgi:glyoxylase-like metal-dependent hydrolase (beta-lactamase superfamily II)
LKIVDGVYQVDGVNGNVHLVEDDAKLTLIDTGLPRSSGKIIKHIKQLGYEPSSVTTIILTHFHIDHVGSAKKMQELTNAKIAVHEAEADVVAAKKSPPKPKKLLVKALNSIFKATPVEPNLQLKDGDKIGGLLVIHTPGHSEGSISLLDEKRKVMFVGDGIRFVDGKVKGPPERFTLDMARAKESIRRISTFDFDVMLSGHGEPLMPSASDKLKKYYASLK